MTRLTAGAALLWALAGCGRDVVVHSSPSPDGAYTVVVRRSPSLLPRVAPGSGGDGPGRVQLVDAQGEVLAEQAVDMVNRVDQVVWGPHEVDVRFVAVWPLPPP